MSADPIGLIAGDGELPVAIARAAVAQGRDVAVVAFRDVTDPDLEASASKIRWLTPGEVGAALSFLTESGVRQAVMAGKLSKAALLAGRVELDERGRELFARLPDLSDSSVLGVIASVLEADGIALRPQAELVPELLAPEGVLGRVDPTEEQQRDALVGWRIAREIAALDIGQTVAVRAGAVLAVEAVEGTDETILRAGKLSGAGLCIVKVARPEQDLRFDMPTIGPRTMEVAALSGACVVAVEAGRTIVLDRDAVIAQADAAGIALLGLTSGLGGSKSGALG